MKITVTRTFEPIVKTIERCYHECPYFGHDDGSMVCEHPSFKPGTYDAFIITHPQCDVGFPEKCPLLKEAKI